MCYNKRKIEEMDKELVEELLDVWKIPAQEKLLDIGCGNGDIVWYLKQKGKNITGIDIEFKEGKYTEGLLNRGEILMISTKGSRLEVKESNNEYKWPIESGSVALAFSSSVIEHVANIDEFAQENARVLKKGGIVFHYYPSRTAILEAHTGILFGGILQNRLYYKIACKLGKTYQQFSNDPQKCLEYIKNYTYYRSNENLRRIFENHGLYYIKDYSEKTVKAKGYKTASILIENISVAKLVFNMTRSNLQAFMKK
jgi:2-polyprenyl-3-methyl-5-hydroxy-6-metoxy-1,4-benzoquinol methylase